MNTREKKSASFFGEYLFVTLQYDLQLPNDIAFLHTHTIKNKKRQETKKRG
jgi:hypothetical protein